MFPTPVTHTKPTDTAMPTVADRTIGTYRSHAAAQRVVDALADRHDVDLDGMRIVARDLTLVEHVTGRKSWPQVLGRGALGGATVGLFLTVVIGLFSIVGSIGAFWSFVLWGGVLGAAVGASWAALGYWLERGRGDFRSVTDLSAAHYEVVAPTAAAERARSTLSSATP